MKDLIIISAILILVCCFVFGSINYSHERIRIEQDRFRLEMDSVKIEKPLFASMPVRCKKKY